MSKVCQSDVIQKRVCRILLNRFKTLKKGKKMCENLASTQKKKSKKNEKKYKK